jgi:hypothetical protein
LTIPFLDKRNFPLIEDKIEFMVKARQETRIQDLPGAWAKTLEVQAAEGVYVMNPENACRGLMEEIVAKIFNFKGSSVLK